MLSRRALAATFGMVLAGYAAVGIVILDIHMRKAVERRTSLNSFGYRGTPRFAKAPGEHRVALVGGSAAFGIGVPASATLGRALEVRLNRRAQSLRPTEAISVAELAEIGAGARSYVSTLDDYDYLHADVICLYDGYAAADDEPAGGGRRASWVFRHVGYRPVLFDEAARTAASTDVPMSSLLSDTSSADMSCTGLSAAYCAAVADAVQWSVDRGKAVLVATPPFVSRRHEAQQHALAAALQARFGGSPRVNYVDAGTTVDLRDPALSFDHVHLTTAGIERIADSLVDPLWKAIAPPATPANGRPAPSKAASN